MHMSDPLISPPVGGACWAAAAGLLVLCARRVREDVRPGLAARMGLEAEFRKTCCSVRLGAGAAQW